MVVLMCFLWTPRRLPSTYMATSVVMRRATGVSPSMRRVWYQVWSVASSVRTPEVASVFRPVFIKISNMGSGRTNRTVPKLGGFLGSSGTSSMPKRAGTGRLMRAPI